MNSIGEIVESNTASFVAEAPTAEDPPAFGTWVTITTQQGQKLFGVVSLVEYGSVMPGRRAMALGKTHEELQLEMPQVRELLRVSFKGSMVGFETPDGQIVQGLPPSPAGIHDFVERCDEGTLRRFGPPYDFLRLLIDNAERSIPGDELLIAAVRHIKELYRDQEAVRFLIEAGRVLSRLLKDDHERLKAILRRVQ